MNIDRSNAVCVFVAIALVAPLSGHANDIIHVRLTNTSIQLDTDAAKAGGVTFEVTNAADSNTEHEFVVLRIDADEARLPVQNGQVTESRFRKMGEVEDVRARSTKRLSLKLEPGRYVLICNRPGHYAMGMHKSFVVSR